MNAATDVFPLVPVTAAMVARLARIELGGDERERAAGIADPHESDALGYRRIGPPLRQDRDGAGGNRRSDEIEAVGLAAFDGHENIAAFDRARVGRHAVHVEIGGGRLDFSVGRMSRSFMAVAGDDPESG